MSQNGKNIYQAARMAAGLTQERAAELICSSPRSIAAYEAGERIPADDIVVKMVEVYGTQFLAYQHLRSNMELARSILPEIVPTTLPLAILKLQKEVHDFLRVQDEMIEITCDGIISADELPRWTEIMKEMRDVCQAIMSIEFSVMKGDGSGE